jgi:hypothetical protein
MQYLYLARRDKKAVELLGVFNNSQNKSNLVRVHNIESLKLTAEQKFLLENYYLDRKMMWELLIEDFSDFTDFRNQLSARRYDNLPRHMAPKFFTGNQPLTTISYEKPKTMLQRKKFSDT